MQEKRSAKIETFFDTDIDGCEVRVTLTYTVPVDKIEKAKPFMVLARKKMSELEDYRQLGLNLPAGQKAVKPKGKSATGTKEKGVGKTKGKSSQTGPTKGKKTAPVASQPGTKGKGLAAIPDMSAMITAIQAGNLETFIAMDVVLPLISHRTGAGERWKARSKLPMFDADLKKAIMDEIGQVKADAPITREYSIGAEKFTVTAYGKRTARIEFYIDGTLQRELKGRELLTTIRDITGVRRKDA